MRAFGLVLVLLLVTFLVSFVAAQEQSAEQVLDDMISEVLAESEAESSQTCGRMTASVNKRSGPFIGNNIIGSVASGSSVTCSSVSNGWCALSTGGYVSAQFVGSQSSCGSSAPAPSAPSSGASCGTMTASVNKRSSPAIANNVIGSVANGASVRCNSISNGWCALSTGGYVSAQFVRSGSCGSTSTPTTPVRPSGGDLTAEQFRATMPGISSTAMGYLPFVNAAIREGNLNTCLRKAAFLAQLGHESMSLRYMEEIASGAAYEGRRDLGNTQPGDGRRYKGRGPIQLTGRANYRSAGRALGLDLEGNPTQAASPQVGFRIAVWFWNTRSLSSYADQGTQSGFDQVTRRINGGYNGKADRDNRWRTARRVLGC